MRASNLSQTSGESRAVPAEQPRKRMHAPGDTRGMKQILIVDDSPLVAARLGGTRLLDNIAIDIGATAGTDGQQVGLDEHHELPWRN